MAGIEEAFKKFVTRVSSGEEPQSEYGDPQTGEKRIPIMQGIKRGYDFKNTMPNIYNQRYGYENETPVYNDDRYNIPQQELAYGGRAGYETGGDVSEEQSLIEKILEGKINIGAGFGNKNKDDPFNKYGFGEREIKDPRLGIEYIMDPGNERSSKIGISVGPKGGGISFMKPFSEKLNEEKNEDVVQTYIDFAKNVWGVEVTEQEARKALGIYDMPDTSIRNELPPEEKAYGGRVSMSDGGLTTTVPPAKGPDSQGVESLFRRRYS
jgi:hypothetical protein